MHIYLLFGITGDLARKKVIPALHDFTQSIREKSGSDQMYMIGVGRKPEPPKEFSILGTGANKAQYIQGEIDQKKTYQLVRQYIEQELLTRRDKSTTQITITLYSALPPHMHVVVAESIVQSVFDVLQAKIKVKSGYVYKFNIVIEKPVGTSLKSAQGIIDSFARYKDKVQVYFVDHYLTKDALIYLEQIQNHTPTLLSHVWSPQEVREVKVCLYETHGVEGRGAFYDPVGALYDVGQNHLLQVLARCIQMQIVSLGVKSGAVPSIAKIVHALSIKGDMLFGQYKGYLEVESVPVHSKTETFFHVSFHIVGALAKRYPELKHIQYTISAGKAVSKQQSGIELIYKKHKSYIDFSKGTHDAYFNMFNAVYEKDIRRFADPESILATWKLVERIKKIKTKSNLIVYTKAHDIIS